LDSPSETELNKSNIISLLEEMTDKTFKDHYSQKINDKPTFNDNNKSFKEIHNDFENINQDNINENIRNKEEL
jgi:hypothetical protein